MENVFRILAIALVVFYMFCINGIKADTTVKLNHPSKGTNSGKPSVKFPFISDEINSQFKELPKQHKMQACGFQNYRPKWDEIDKNLAQKIKGYNSRMDNWRVVEGAYSRKVFQEYSSAITYSMVSEDEDLKERLFDKLYQWAVSDALTSTIICYSRNPNRRLLPECEGEWSDKDGKDLAPVKDATVSIEIAIGLNYIYGAFFKDYKVDDSRHRKINEWLKKWHKRYPVYNDFYWGNSVGWSFPNIFAKHQTGKDYKILINKVIEGANKWIQKDGSLKDRTTRGNRALWYHSSGLGEAFMILELAYASNLKLPKNFEPKLLKAVELWHKAMLDNSAITVWAKKGHNAQFDPNNPDYQKYSRLDVISFNGIWFHVFQYRYPSHPTAKFIKEQMSPQARSLKTDGYLGFGVGCIYNALANREM